MQLFLDVSERYTEEGKDIDNEVVALIRPLFEKYLGKGCKARPLSYVIQSAVRDIELESLLWYRKENK